MLMQQLTVKKDGKIYVKGSAKSLANCEIMKLKGSLINNKDLGSFSLISAVSWGSAINV